jgi:ABC-type antimicrobial peptide transport system permease subunit
MFGLSFIWHGVLLNDFKFIQYDKSIFLGLLALLYLFIAFGISFILSLYQPEEHKTTKHFGIGGIIGFILYLIVFVLGISLAGKGLTNNIINFLWQMLEQGIGAFVISVYLTIAHRKDKIMAFADELDS